METQTARKGQRGYILAMVLAGMTVMGILLTRAMPSVITEVQRENEDELIFRGESIALAIRAYRARTGGYPTSLEDLVKVKPRILRKVYKDPMTPDGQWELITAVQAGTSGSQAGLPIVGVRSRSLRDSFRSYRSKTLYRDWVFAGADDIFGIPGLPQSLPTPIPNTQTK